MSGRRKRESVEGTPLSPVETWRGWLGANFFGMAETAWLAGDGGEALAERLAAEAAWLCGLPRREALTAAADFSAEWRERLATWERAFSHHDF